MIANPCARILLSDDWNVSVTNTQCDPEKILREHDVAFVFLREDQLVHDKWVEGLKTGRPFLQRIEIEEFAKALTRELRELTGEASKRISSKHSAPI